jgi:2-polyprenyl-3-methyl-5-hydroxy-6-metoxy-1,4-benzoquinol methylase
MLKFKLYKIKQKLKRFLKNLISFKPYYRRVNSYWVQELEVKSINNRLNYFIDRCANKDVIHFGCTDWPIFNPKNNLHIQLSEHAKTIDGFDIDKEGIENLKEYVNQNYYSEYSEIPKKKYDICLVPETIEHVNNIEVFLKNISKINANTFIITGPNCFSKSRRNNFFIKKGVL